MEKNSCAILLHTDNEENVKFLSYVTQILFDKPIYLFTSYDEALIAIQKKDPGIVFINHNLERHIDSVRFINYVREILHYTVPIVIFTNHGTEEIAIQAMLAGANDYFVTKRIKSEEIRSRLKEVFTCYEKAEKIRNDLTLYKDLCCYDELTKLHNRYGLKQLLSKELAFAIRHKFPLTCLYLDLDNFKEVNDIQGHNIGDAILIETAKRLKLCTRKEDIVARHGGDEFIIICVGLSDREKIISLASKIINSIQRKYESLLGDAFVSISIGISISEKNSTIECLINKADKALRKAKISKGIFMFSDN